MAINAVDQVLTKPYVHQILPEYECEEMDEIIVKVENQEIKRKHIDFRIVNSFFIRRSKVPGIQIFVFEPSKRNFNSNGFKLNESSILTIHANGWIYTSKEIVITKRPAHVIVYAVLSGYELPQGLPTISFDPQQRKRREEMAEYGWTPEKKSDCRIIGSTAITLSNESDYRVAEIRNSKRSKPIHMKFLGSVNGIETNEPTVGILETNAYFERSTFPLQAGCYLFDGSRDHLITSVSYLEFPVHPILTLADVVPQKL